MTTEYYKEDEGIHFDPTYEEVIHKYLKPKLRGEDCGDFILMKDVYAKEPWLLDHPNNSFFKEDEWYYFSTRTQISEKKIGRGKYPKRKIDNNDGIDRGNWRINAKEDIIDKDTGDIIGIKKNLTYKGTNTNKKQKRGDGASAPSSESGWIMDEFVIVLPKPDEDKFQELVVCKIHKKKESKKDKKDHQHEASSSSEQQPIKKRKSKKSKKEHESVLAASSEQQQPLLCGCNESEIPKIASSPCSAAETERNGEQSGEGNMVHQTEKNADNDIVKLSLDEQANDDIFVNRQYRDQPYSWI
ncbi:NAC domain [Arabidopsis thaliana x Arabidopsis arenosa]|uniref:NAC domain n=1 Tax=Arabidopsis thaliana x Arabidopsis arenosa TaxID=1240361 RepID=A0A8T1XUF6_9BRAS|nr:NAC domain [Arabidopsis thaliana x Arabidopsis arenosa]